MAVCECVFEYFYYYYFPYMNTVVLGMCGYSDENNTHAANRSEAHTLFSHTTKPGRLLLLYLLVAAGSLRDDGGGGGGGGRRTECI